MAVAHRFRFLLLRFARQLKYALFARVPCVSDEDRGHRRACPIGRKPTAASNAASISSGTAGR
jgi:hypothetical protein